MNEYISFVKDTGNEQFEFIDEKNEHLFVGPISTVNILVGANNSRKSRFIRMLLKSTDIPIVTEELKTNFWDGLDAFSLLSSKIGSDELINVVEQDMNIMNANRWLSSFDNYKTQNQQEHFDLFQTSLRKAGDRFVFDQETVFALKDRFVELFNKREDIQKTNNGIHITRIADFFELLYQNQHETRRIGGEQNKIAFDLISKLKDEFLELNRCFKCILEDTTQTPKDRKLFVPSLRGSLPLYKNPFINEPLYEQTTRECYFTNKNNHDGASINTLSTGAKINAGDNLYDTILIDRNSNIAQREKFMDFQKFVSHGFFGDKRVEIVSEPKSAEQKISIFIEGEEERELKNLGDGIQHLLILLYPIFMAEESTWIFIDEPELSLHPGFQNLLLETILNNEDLKKKNLRYFMTTHSNHFLSHALREPDNVSVFSFCQYDDKQSTIRCVHGADTKVLDQLGVENASVYMANCSIWVEGVSDRKYIQAFLKSYCSANDLPEFKEGLDYTFFEYAGTNLNHYLFDPETDDPEMIDSFKGANRIFLLADKDKGKEEKHAKYSTLNLDNFEYRTTEAREIENTLPPQILHDFLDLKGEIVPVEQLNGYQDVYMGGFLMGLEKTKRKYGTGTLETRYKNDLADMLLAKNYTWEQFKVSEDIEDITGAIYKFIQKHNRN